MWILPKNLQLSSGAPDTAGFISDLNEQSQICASSLMARSKASPARTWLQKWKRDSWTQHLSGRILRPSHARTFVTEWTSLWPVTPASHFPQPGSDSAQKTLATSGHTSPDQYELFDLDYASLRMSKDISPSDSEKSLENWNQSVTRRRGEYSARLKSGRGTNEGGFLFSLPTPRHEEYKGVGQMGNKAWCHWIGRRYLTPYLHCLHLVWKCIAFVSPESASIWMEAVKSLSVPNVKSILRIAHVSAPAWTMILIIKRILRGNLRLTPNPKFMEVLMGLPIGWTACDSSATESCLPPQSELFAF